MYGCYLRCVSAEILEIFQKPPNGLYIAAKRLIHFYMCFLCCWMQCLAVRPCTARRLKACISSGLFLDEGSGGIL